MIIIHKKRRKTLTPVQLRLDGWIEVRPDPDPAHKIINKNKERTHEYVVDIFIKGLTSQHFWILKYKLSMILYNVQLEGDVTIDVILK